MSLDEPVIQPSEQNRGPKVDQKRLNNYVLKIHHDYTFLIC